jgi:lysophospholipase L1-like esterase
MRKNGYFIKILFLFIATIFILLGILYNEYILELFDKNPPLNINTKNEIRFNQIYFISFGLLLLLISKFISANREIPYYFEKFSILLILFIIPLIIVEVSLNPVLRNKVPTSIFIEDKELGWKLNPGSYDYWGGVKVKINNKGIRGKEIDYTKNPEKVRILYLGDSVTFGYKIEHDNDTFPSEIEKLLEKKTDLQYETINAGVGGYSPWQEYIYFKQEGIKYNPDLVVLSFVLNDVTEKFGLTRFGGSGIGYQLGKSIITLRDYLQTKSNLFFLANKLFVSLMTDDLSIDKAKQKELIQVSDLINSRNSNKVKSAWKLTIDSIQQIINYSKEHDIPLLLVIFPFTFQFDDIQEYDIPQRILKDSFTNKVKIIDLLPILEAYIKRNNLLVKDLFFDGSHLNESGCEIVANILTSQILQALQINCDYDKSIN